MFKNMKTRPSSSIQNPFVKGSEGRAEWNDRYMNMKQMIRCWQLAFFAAIIAVVVLAIVLGKIATESKVQPFVVETNNGMPYAIKPMEKISSQDQRLINFAVNQFIINARTIINDSDAEKALLNKLYAYTANNAINFLHDYYQKSNPFELASQYSVTVSIVNSLPISKNTWQITWDETKHSTNGGSILGTSRWVANVTYKVSDVNSNFIADNPFGLYITEITWSQNQI
jgi:type IV secretory pathway TrbF-like protein